MSAAAPAPAPAPTPNTPATPVPSRPRVGELHDSGTIRKEAVDAGRWFATGLVKVTGDVNVGSGKLDGTVAVGGRLSAASLRYHGTLDVTGPVDASAELDGAGSLRAGSTVHAVTADLRGTVHCIGALTIDRTARVRGALSAPAATVGELDLEGDAHLPGDLSALRVTAVFKDDSELGTVRARTVTLRGRPPNLVEKVFFRRVSVKVARVEADAADLESVDVRFVRAPQITLGRDAHVTEYEGTIAKRHPTSRVGFESKSPPPYGLRR